MKWAPVPLILLLAPPIQSPSKPDCEADVFVLQDIEKQPHVPSPDGRYGIVLSVASEDDDYGEIRVYEQSKLLGKYVWKDLSAGVFVKWSDDSRAVYVNWSNGGQVGGYELRVFEIDDSVVRELRTATKAAAEFGRQYPCKTRGHNVYPIRWLDGSREMLLAMEVFPASDCGRNMGQVRGYRVRAADGAIVERYSEKQLGALAPPTCPAPFYPTAFWTSEELAKAKAALRKQRGGG